MHFEDLAETFFLTFVTACIIESLHIPLGNVTFKGQPEATAGQLEISLV